MRHALIFDLDGTLVDSLAGISASLNRALDLSGLPPHSEAAVRGFIGNGARILVLRAAHAEATPALIDRLECDFKTDYDSTWPGGTVCYDGMAGLLETLQALGHPLAVLSNKPHAFTVAMVARMFPLIRFAAVVGQRAGIPHKPDPAGALEISAQLGLDPDACTIIGDSIMDIETGRNAGMRSIAVTWGFQHIDQLTAAQPGWIVNSPGELATLLRQTRFSSST